MENRVHGILQRCAAIPVFLFCLAGPVAASGRWLAGDLHSHTLMTDGSISYPELFREAFQSYGLNWMANAEHGGAYETDGYGIPWDDPSLSTVFLGDPVFGSGHRAMWRWQSLREASYPLIRDLRVRFPRRRIIQGLEWHVPAADEASIGIVAGQPRAISDFEYRCDAADLDSSRNAALGLDRKPNQTRGDMLACAGWLRDRYGASSYMILNHPSRRLGYRVADIRRLNDAAPSVCIGFEAFPGHQKGSSRGAYGNGPFTDAAGSDITFKARTYGGADYMAAKVGGLWDALLGEGRRFWAFASSDFHSTSADFWPGEYAKTHVFADDANGDSFISLPELVDGLRSGNSFVCTGDLIRRLRFSVSAGGAAASMGQTLTLEGGGPVEVTVSLKSPAFNHNGDRVAVHHVDLIAGRVTGRIDPAAPEYRGSDGNPTSVVRHRFHRHDMRTMDGWQVMKTTIEGVNEPIYLRLRGTNLAPGAPGETDAAGNPLMDDLAGPNDAAKAYADLWFYSNPVFIEVR